ncbi:MAG: PD40 domain-containing protein [Deltaproteobacteria bacterium]|nr:PD40 domain-containing protein [Deltaproteobacteria bacterium]
MWKHVLGVWMLLLALVVAGAEPARAATFDPDLTWRTIPTEHFNITFHQGEEQLAEEFSQMAEEVFAQMQAELRWKPRRPVEVLLIDRTDIANGYAGSTPYPRIVIFVTAPQENSSLGLYEDWSRTILTHELTHVLHMDTNHGIVRLARMFVGRIASTNEISPRWMIEGLATYLETEHTTGGRGRAPLADMIIRTSVIEDEFPPLGNMDGIQPDPPSGNLRYLFGEDFVRYVAEHQGENVWTRWTHIYGSSIPYILPSKWVFGRELVPMYRDWRSALEEQYGRQVAVLEEQGVREGRLVSIGDASCTAPSFSPDGDKLVWSCYDLRRGSRIWMADGWGYAPEVLLEKRGAKNFTWRNDSEAFVYAGLHIVNRFNTWSDIYLYTLGDTSPTALSSGKRARDPDFSPDGSRLLVVTNKVQNTQMEVMTVDRRMEPLTDLTDHTQFSTPRYAPDGRVIAASVWKDGRRDLWLYSPEGTPLRRLTMDAAVDRDPEWSADGRWLYFSSDRSGIPNVYAIEVDSERLYQVTNVRTGAALPSVHPDGTLLAYQQYSHDGWDVRILDLDPDRFLDRGLLPRSLTWGTPIRDLTDPVDAPVEPDATASLWEGDRLRRGGGASPAPLVGFQSPEETTDSFDQVDIKDLFGEEQEYPFTIPPRRYNPLPTLLPRYYLPVLQLSPYPSTRFRFLPTAFALSAVTGTSDPALHYGWSAGITYRSDADFVGGSFGFTVNRFLPVYSVGFSRRAVPFPLYFADPYRVGPDGRPEVTLADDPYWERRYNAAFTVSYPYRPRTTVFAQYAFTARDDLRGIPDDAWEERIPMRGTIGRISAGWRYAWIEPTAYAITREDGRIFSLVGSFLHPWLGTQITTGEGEERLLTQVQITTELREYVVNPLIPNHVLAGRIAAGAAIGGTEFLGTYQLGGNVGDGAFYVTPDEFRMLRGYPFGADVGDYYWLAGAEYRFPLWRVQRGVGTIPAYVRNLTGLVFVDAGNALARVDDLDVLLETPLVGVGGELQLNLFLGWNLGMNMRFGYATGLTHNGYAWNDPRTLYLRFGGTY